MSNFPYYGIAAPISGFERMGKVSAVEMPTLDAFTGSNAKKRLRRTLFKPIWHAAMKVFDKVRGELASVVAISH
ncbi:hypothetical protein [Falsiphaeobacter marinintestinus]|uniref:hypothetical protein n=1 Tax=Falsiphaeobacter marinintestinus TaxID=1492905 RepID=UPI0011B44A67|nr:hypothetical protein [Phaeobacter marinintestinus]